MKYDAYLWLGCGIVLLLLMIITFRIALQSATRQFELKLAHQKAMVAEQNLALQRVAEDLHDQLGQLVFLLGLQLKEVQHTCTGTALLQALQLKEQIDITLRNICNTVSPVQMYKYTLQELMQELLSSYRYHAYLQLHLEEHGISSLPLTGDQKVLIIRILKEVIQNCLKHTNADKIELQVHYSAAEIVITLVDNHTEKRSENTGIGMGLNSIAARVQLLGAQHQYNYDQQTMFTMKVPLEHNI